MISFWKTETQAEHLAVVADDRFLPDEGALEFDVERQGHILEDNALRNLRCVLIGVRKDYQRLQLYLNIGLFDVKPASDREPRIA